MLANANEDSNIEKEKEKVVNSNKEDYDFDSELKNCLNEDFKNKTNFIKKSEKINLVK